MFKFKTLSLFALLAFTFTSCDLDDINDLCEKGEGETVSRTLELESFHSIVVDVSADVFLQQGDVQSITVEGQENIIDLLELDVRNETWEIDFNKNCVRQDQDLKIFITIPDIQRLEIDGSGNLTGENLFVLDNLNLLIDGSGDLDVAVEAEEVTARIEGSGDILLEGSTDIARYIIRGSGDIRAFDMQAISADVEIRGSGEVEVSVSDFLKVDIDGSGDVYYKGDPEIDLRVDGSGELKDAN